MENKEKSIGCFWTKTSGAGKVYYSGNIEIKGEKIYLVGFVNDNKTKETQPDISIYVSKPKEGTQPKKEELKTIQQDEDISKEVPF